MRLHPTLIIPPLPAKHTLVDYAVKQGHAKEDPAVIMSRKRLLQRFLRRLDTHPVLKHDSVFRRFLDARFSWHEIERTPPLSTLPKSNFCAPPNDPSNQNASPAYQALPVPHMRALNKPNVRFQDSEAFTNRFASHMSSKMEKSNRKLVRRWTDISSDYSELGAVLNGLSLSETHPLSQAIERTGQAADATYMAIGELLQQWEALVTEPLHEYTQFAAILQKTITWRHLKHVQFETVQDLLAEKRAQLAEYERVEAEAQRLQAALERGGRGLLSQNAAASQTASRSMQQSVYGAAAEDEDQSQDSPWSRSSERASTPTEMPQGTTGSASGSMAPKVPVGTPRRGMFGSLRQTVQNIMDVDPEKTRQSSISRLREEVLHLEEGVKLTERDLEYASTMIQASLDRFQRLKVADFKQLLLDYAHMHREYCRKGLEVWEHARDALNDVDPSAFGGMPDATLTTQPRASSSNWRADS